MKTSRAQAAQGVPATEADVRSGKPQGAGSQQDQRPSPGQPCDAAPQVGTNVVHCWLDYEKVDAHQRASCCDLLACLQHMESRLLHAGLNAGPIWCDGAESQCCGQADAGSAGTCSHP